MNATTATETPGGTTHTVVIWFYRLTRLFPQKPVYRCGHCGEVINFGNVLIMSRQMVHATQCCVWGFGRRAGKTYRNIPAISFKKATKQLSR